MRFYSPLRYPGGKGGIFKFVSKLFHENNLIGSSYAEPYAGGAGLALRLLCEEYVNHIYINDLDKTIYSFWLIALNDTDRFCEWINEVDITVNNWHKYKEVRNNLNGATDFEIAQSTFFLNRTNVSGVLTGGVIGGLSQLGKYKIDARFNKLDLIRRIEHISSFRKRITISNSDGLAFIRKMNKKIEPVFIYLDPPYYEKGSQLYLNSYIDKDHKKLAEYVHQLRSPWMVSYDNQKFIMNLYANYSKAVYQFSQCASNRIGDEVLIFSDELIYKAALNNLNSPYMIEPTMSQ